MATKIIRNFNDVHSAIDIYAQFALQKVEQLVKDKINEFIRYYYHEYEHPEFYDRQWKFLNSLMSTGIQKIPNGYEVTIYIDTSITYPNGYSMKDVAESANAGYHGWSVQIGDGLHFWDDAMEEIKSNKIITEAFATYLKEQGLNVIYK
jgi:hypothetical protein